jgi:hypothetical protein
MRLRNWYLLVAVGGVDRTSKLVFASREVEVKTLWAGVRSAEDIL